jgi:protein-disulfide isomerase
MNRADLKKTALWMAIGPFLLSILALALYGCVTQQQLDALQAQHQQDMQAQHQQDMQALSTEVAKLNQQVQGLQKISPAAKVNPATRTVEVSIKDRDILGDPSAPITLVEFTDYQCPFCKRFTDNTLPAIKAEFIDTGKAKLLVKDLALSGHKQARKAAQASRCAADQGQYWAMHDGLFANSKTLTPETIIQLAKTLKLDETKFAQCLASDRHLDGIATDIAEAQTLGITGTPAFVMGLSNSDKEEVVKGTMIIGAKGIEVFRSQMGQGLDNN